MESSILDVSDIFEIDEELNAEMEGIFSHIEYSDSTVNIFDDIVKQNLDFEIV